AERADPQTGMTSDAGGSGQAFVAGNGDGILLFWWWSNGSRSFGSFLPDCGPGVLASRPTIGGCAGGVGALPHGRPRLRLCSRPHRRERAANPMIGDAHRRRRYPMLFEFLETNRNQLVERCREKVALRAAPRATAYEMEHGIPLFLAQMTETLRLEQQHSIPNAPGRDVDAELMRSATRHGLELLQHGFAIDQVVHDYGDLCQAVTELAVELD